MSGPIRLHPDNGKRFLWRGKAQFLLGSTEHYGALLNAAFDYERYLDTIAATGLNTTRVFAFYRELEASIVELGYANPVAPRPEGYLAPWARAGAEHGLGPDGLPKFDLDTWDERYFARLGALLSAADTRGVVVELVFFSSQYNEAAWRHSPLHPASNVNGVGTGVRTWRDFLTLADDTVAEHQRRVVRKLVAETNAFDNLYYEVCNEPGYSDESGPRPDLVRAWQRAFVSTVREVEAPLPKRHLVAVNGHQTLPVRDPDAPGETSIAVLDDGYYHRDPEIDFINVHYISHRAPREGLSHDYAGGARPRHQRSYRFGQLTTFTTLRAAGKPIGFNEDYAGFVSNQPPKPTQARMEAWESLLLAVSSTITWTSPLLRTIRPEAPRGRRPTGCRASGSTAARCGVGWDTCSRWRERWTWSRCAPTRSPWRMRREVRPRSRRTRTGSDGKRCSSTLSTCVCSTRGTGRTQSAGGSCFLCHRYRPARRLRRGTRCECSILRPARGKRRPRPRRTGQASSRCTCPPSARTRCSAWRRLTAQQPHRVERRPRLHRVHVPRPRRSCSGCHRRPCQLSCGVPTGVVAATSSRRQTGGRVPFSVTLRW